MKVCSFHGLPPFLQSARKRASSSHSHVISFSAPLSTIILCFQMVFLHIPGQYIRNLRVKFDRWARVRFWCPCDKPRRGSLKAGWSVTKLKCIYHG